eukprot:5117760-Alexandrium_andersonii.AAC.1
MAQGPLPPDPPPCGPPSWGLRGRAYGVSPPGRVGAPWTFAGRSSLLTSREPSSGWVFPGC